MEREARGTAREYLRPPHLRCRQCTAELSSYAVAHVNKPRNRYGALTYRPVSIACCSRRVCTAARDVHTWQGEHAATRVVRHTVRDYARRQQTVQGNSASRTTAAGMRAGSRNRTHAMRVVTPLVVYANAGLTCPLCPCGAALCGRGQLVWLPRN